MSTQGVTYTVDLILCIDATGSMGHIIDRVKESALRFHEDLGHQMQAKAKTIDSLRLKVIAFRDYYVDGEKSVMESRFFPLPEEKVAFSEFIHSVTAEGGGDEPETGLEALALAIRSAWSRTGDRKRQIVVVWTDASTHPLDKDAPKKPANYPRDMPKNLDELTDMWDGQTHMNRAAKRLIIYAPDAYAWTDIANHWDNTLHFPSAAGEGMKDVEYQEILSAIANSV